MWVGGHGIVDRAIWDGGRTAGTSDLLRGRGNLEGARGFAVRDGVGGKTDDPTDEHDRRLFVPRGDDERIAFARFGAWCGRWDSNPHDVAIEGF